jgi:hypothetical protein
MKRKIECIILAIVFGLLSINLVFASGFTFSAAGWRAPDKDPVAILDYTIDWHEWLDTDTIKSSTWEADAGITIDTTSGTTTTTTVWLSGGTAETKYEITNTITTTGNRTTRQSFTLWVKNL